MIKKFGLIGFPLGHSFSKRFYDEKIARQRISDIEYHLFPLKDVRHFPSLYDNDPSVHGFNVTIPHKQSVIPFLDSISEEATQIGAVNCIRIDRANGQRVLTGHNTDVYGFEKSLTPLLKPHHHQSLVLGNGGAAKAVVFVLQKLGIQVQLVSRTKEAHTLTYAELNEEIVRAHPLIINCSPVGTYPAIGDAPDIPYAAITAQHYLYDLIYNPAETVFLKKGREKGASTKNGHEMLVLQAEKNWEIWLS